MSGIYIHIPFCRQACHYCDFHFSTNLEKQGEMVDAICKEIRSRSAYLDETVHTIYFGGGTPSLLTQRQVDSIITAIRDSFEVSSAAELTLEANPEDLSPELLNELLEIGINRLSIGFQTFDDEKLAWMNRIHSKQQAITSFQNARKAGFNNLSVDLIYALPNATRNHWHQDMESVFLLAPDHISLYGLTIEEKTAFGHQKDKGTLIELPEEEAATQYLAAIEHLETNGYEQYEVANFSKPGFQSRHNSSYWEGKPYLGVGPGAHSFNGKTRRFNVRNNARYLREVVSGQLYYEMETLTPTQRLNEHILTRLRQKTGIQFEDIKRSYGVDLIEKNKETFQYLKQHELINLNSEGVNLTSKGFLVADDIALRLFFPE